jgi:hypothetical protein
MFQASIAAFVGCFAALVALAEIQIKSRPVKYLVALLAGAFFTVLLTLVLDWMLKLLGHAQP